MERMTKTVVITGAGSGVGRATAVALAEQGWSVVLVGRRQSALAETAKLCGKNILVCPCDLRKAIAVKQMVKKASTKFGFVSALVYAAGTNAPKRSLAQVSEQDYWDMVDTNLTGAYLCAQAFLPAMRQRKTGTIVNIVSDAAKQASGKAGVAYVISKSGQAGLTQAINAEERGNGIRACAIFPGDIDTPLLKKRPVPPSDEARGKMLQPEDVAQCVLLALNLPARAIVEEILVRPR